METRSAMQDAQDLLQQVTRFRQEAVSRQAGQSAFSRAAMDNMISNLGNPRLAEKMRIHKLVESQFDKIQIEVKAEVQNKISRAKEAKKAELESIRTKKILNKSQDFRKKEITKRKLNFAKQNESIIYPNSKERSVSFKEHIDNQKENTLTKSAIKFEVLEKKFNRAASPSITNKTNPIRNNMGVYEMRNPDTRQSNKNKKSSLSCHILPSVNIRPALVVENIPGLYFIGNQRKPNLKIKVEHVVEDIAQEVSGAVEENKFEDLSVTDSTTSKFEKMEKIVKTLSEDQDSVVNDHAPSSKTNNNISKFVTEEEYKLIERNLLRQRVHEILQNQIMKNEAAATPPEHSEPSQAAEITQELEKETKESKLKSEEPNLDDKYSSSFETASCDIDGNISEKLDNCESGVGVADVGLQDAEDQSDQNSSSHAEVNLEASSCDHVLIPNPGGKDSDSLPFTSTNISETAHLDDNEDDVIDEIPETPPVPLSPPAADYPAAGTLLSTIEEVTTVADTEEEEDGEEITTAGKDVDVYSDNFVTSNISDTAEAAPEMSDGNEDDVKTDASFDHEEIKIRNKDNEKEDSVYCQERDLESSREGVLVYDEDTNEVAHDKVVTMSAEDRMSSEYDVETGVLSDDEDQEGRDETDGRHIEQNNIVRDENKNIYESVSVDESVENIRKDLEELDADGDSVKSELKIEASIGGDVNIKILDVETGELTPDKREESDEGDNGRVIRVSPNVSGDDLGTDFEAQKREESPPRKIEEELGPPLVEITVGNVCNVGKDAVISVDNPGQSDVEEENVSRSEPDTAATGPGPDTEATCDTVTSGHVSEGEVVAGAGAEASEGELSLGGSSEAAVAGAEDTSRGELGSSSSSSWSEGEWRASPTQMRRLINMAAAFRMINKQ